MNKARKAICPYCCQHFEPSDMWFRQSDDSQESVVDEKLKVYFMEYEDMSEEEAQNEATLLPAVHIDIANDMSKMTDFNKKMLNDYGFVTELKYEGHRLTERLCPHCHNIVVPGAGMYEMKIIAMYGDTNSGKTVFLHVLEAILKGDPRLGEYVGAFHGMLTFQGTDEEKENHEKAYEQLIADRVLFEATHAGRRVAPQAFKFSYRTADHAGEDRDLLIVFCDIAGEDTKAVGSLRKSGFYLRKADGIISLLDTSRLTNVMNYTRGGIDGEDVGKTALRAENALTTLADYLAAEFNGGKIEIPTAVVLTKSDILKKVPAVTAEERFKNIYAAENANEIHKKYLNRKVIVDLQDAIRKMLEVLGGTLFCNTVERCFKDYNLFAVSALGKSPVKESVTDKDGNPRMDLDGNPVMLKKVGGILEPYRVAEPFYWILAKCNCIPYFFSETWENTKNKDKKNITFYYYERERGGVAQQRLKEIKEQKGIREPSGLGRLFGPSWRLVKRECGF